MDVEMLYSLGLVGDLWKGVEDLYVSLKKPPSGWGWRFRAVIRRLASCDIGCSDVLDEVSCMSSSVSLWLCLIDQVFSQVNFLGLRL